MIGRRVHAGRGGVLELSKPGDYGKDNRGTWWVIPPTESDIGFRFPLNMHQDVSRDWKIVENPNKTITVTPSIWYMPHLGKAANEWHGHLINGEWRSV